MGAYGAFWRNYFNFSGRSTRSEFWWPYIINIVIALILGFLAGPQSSHWWTAPFGIATVVVRFVDYHSDVGIDCSSRARHRC